MMNTERSERKTNSFLKYGKKRKRKIQVCKKRFSATAEKVFFQLCPSREYDWIEGWECELVYTSTGYAEAGCIFTTPRSNDLGQGIWLFTQYIPHERVELAIVNDAIVEQVRIDVIDNGDGTSTGIWKMTFTALNETGDDIVASMPDTNAELERAVEGLEYFLTTGELLED